MNTISKSKKTEMPPDLYYHFYGVILACYILGVALLVRYGFPTPKEL